MEVLILGSGTGVPWRQRAACSVLVKTKGLCLLLDMGPGVLRRLSEEGLDFQELDAIFLSHFHPDHTADLWPYFFATRGSSFERAEEVVLVASEGFLSLAAGLEAAYGRWVKPREGLLRTVLLDPLKRHFLEPLPGLNLDAAPTLHTPHSLAFRLEAKGRALVYSGDTDYAPELIALSQGADLLILESALPEGMKVEGHLTPALAGRLAAEAKVKTLVLTHFYPETAGQDMLTPAQKEFGGPVILAADGMRLRV